MEGMDDRTPQPLDRYAPETALTRLIRIPVRIVVLVVVLPVRMVWDLLAAGWYAVDRTVLPPLRRALEASAGAWGGAWSGCSPPSAGCWGG